MCDADARRDDDRYARALDHGKIVRNAIHVSVTAKMFEVEFTGSIDFTHEVPGGADINYDAYSLAWFEEHCDLDRCDWFGPTGGPVDPHTLVGHLIDGEDGTIVDLLCEEFHFDVDWD
ncbi:MAG: hypothetical protein GY934_09730 [Gammaproteobacteria bacterium]|nr:hypothetical protein [Gammaproteobacteria bacterium]